MKNKTKSLLLFAIGGIGYCILEIIWRGFTHPTMGVAGGLCLLVIAHINKKFYRCTVLVRSVLCGICITAVELVFGIIFNVIFRMNVWDYSNRAFNLWGQICPMYTVLWCALSLPVIGVLNKAK